MINNQLKVLHSVSTYLPITENWIYPQITGVTGVSSRVLCDRVLNRETFAIEQENLFVKVPLWRKWLGIPRAFHAIGRRIGLEGNYINSRIQTWKPNVLHAHFGSLGWECLTLKKKLQCPLVTSFYGYDAWMLPNLEPAWLKRYQELFDEGDVFLVEGSAMRNRLCKLGCSEKKVVIQRIGVNLNALKFEKMNFSDGLKVIMVGRFIEKKGLIDGLRACVLAKSYGVKLTLTIIGDAAVDDIAGQLIKAELSEIADCTELIGCIDFKGFVPLHKTRDLLKEHNVFLCPSKHAANGDAEGGSPVILTEAMAIGLLCIGTDHCDIPEIIVNGKTGFLSAEGDVKGLAKNLLIVAEDKESALRMSKAGRGHVEQNFHLPTQMNSLLGIYQTI